MAKNPKLYGRCRVVVDGEDVGEAAFDLEIFGERPDHVCRGLITGEPDVIAAVTLSSSFEMHTEDGRKLPAYFKADSDNGVEIAITGSPF